MQVTSLGFATDVALRVAEGAEVTDRGDCLVVRSPDNPAFWWGNFLLLAAWPGDSDGWLDRFAAEFPQARHVAVGVDAAEAGGGLPAEFAALEPETSPAEGAIRVYRDCGFADAQTQFSFARGPT